jgi:hypothetical protein
MSAKSGRVPPPVQIQLARLFGENSREARAEFRTRAQWRKTLKRILLELDRYQNANVQTDELHNLILASGLCASDDALKSEDFWPGYVEGLVRFALCLMGDYPDHRKRKTGKRRSDHYDLKANRSLIFVQNPEQQFRTLFSASQMKLPKIPRPFWEVTDEFYRSHSYSRRKGKFMKWFKRKYPEAYASIF